MSETWKITAFAPREIIQFALLAHEEALEWDFDIVPAKAPFVQRWRTGHSTPIHA